MATELQRGNPAGSEKGMTHLQKLAALLILLGEDSASILLKHFDDNERELISAEMANLPLMNLEQQTSVLKEFTELALQANAALGGSVEYTRAVLEKSVGLFKAAEIIGRVSTRRTSVATMQQIIDMEPLAIVNLIKEEQPQTISLVISYLSAQKGAEVLLNLPEHLSEQVIERLATLSSTPIEVVETVGEVLSKKIGPKISRALNQTGGVKSAAAVLNVMDKTHRQNILNKLDERTPELVRSIRMKMFTFDDLAILDNKSLQKILREIDASTLAIALSAANENLRNALLGAISKRAADTVMDEISNLGRITLREIEHAQDSIIDIVRKLEAEGEISLDVGA
ncbi:MAG: flagellar motor switch protein FliG [Verrucomicrobia bacterium]|nr:flagellar motor switch protein FliG [Verrucomicrobiota bacterium]